MTRLLLGVLDKGILRLGDNSTVNFEKSLVFLTSNLGAREMMKEINPDFGFQSAGSKERPAGDLTNKLQAIALLIAERGRGARERGDQADLELLLRLLLGCGRTDRERAGHGGDAAKRVHVIPPITRDQV